MPQFFLAYHGGTMPETQEARDALMARWGAWMAEVGPALDPNGAPLGALHTVTDGGTTATADADPMTGFNMLTAASLDDALALIAGHPHLDDGTIRIAEMKTM
ncbi:hypothetical protein [Rubrivirga sp. IMCC43871]|uniref:hypothetical protein n=1 Tax=Rubrivirga sp. IMCC43871 TaxID=3391575 RepID=UPI0039902D1F